MKTLLFALALVGLSVPTLHAQLDDTDPQYRAVCREALAKPFVPPPADPALKPGCDSTVAYFGIGQPVDYKAALACAYSEYAQPGATFNPANPFPGAGILSMIYANGQGTPQNLELATRFTCENWAAPAEIEARLDLLAAARENHTTPSLDLCETASSANANDWCTSIEARQSEAERNQRLAAFRSSLPPNAVAPFDALLAAEKDFEIAHIENELDLTGATPAFAGFHTAEKTFLAMHIFDRPASSDIPHGPSPNPPVVPLSPAAAMVPFAPSASVPPVRIASQLEEQNELADHFVEDLKRITASNFASPTDRKNADKNLEAALKLTRAAAPKRLQHTTINYKGIEDTQRVWLNLRDNWIVFITNTSASPILGDQTAAFLALERGKQLNQLVSFAREQ